MDAQALQAIVQAAIGAGGSRPRAVLPTWSEDSGLFEHHKNS